MYIRPIDNQFLIVNHYDEERSKKFYNRYLPIKTLENGKILIMSLVTKCANTTIANLYVNLNITKTRLNRNSNKNFWNLYSMCGRYININDYENRLCVAVIRDPLERIKSAYRTCCMFNYCTYDIQFYYDCVCVIH